MCLCFWFFFFHRKNYSVAIFSSDFPYFCLHYSYTSHRQSTKSEKEEVEIEEKHIFYSCTICNILIIMGAKNRMNRKIRLGETLFHTSHLGSAFDLNGLRMQTNNIILVLAWCQCFVCQHIEHTYVRIYQIEKRRKTQRRIITPVIVFGSLTLTIFQRINWCCIMY